MNIPMTHDAAVSVLYSAINVIPLFVKACVEAQRAVYNAASKTSWLASICGCCDADNNADNDAKYGDVCLFFVFLFVCLFVDGVSISSN